MMKTPLQLSIDTCLNWVLKHEPIHMQARRMVEVYKRDTKVSKATELVKSLDPVKFMFMSEDIYHRHVAMVVNIASNHGVQYKNFTQYTQWRARGSTGTMSKHDWLRFYLNPEVLTEETVQQIPKEVCTAMLLDLKRWYAARALPVEKGGTALYSCCMIAYLEQIKLLVLRTLKPEAVEFYNRLIKQYAEDGVSDCTPCKQKNRKAGRDAKYGVIKVGNL